ncbi:fimbria/pilus periplasmic chaperone [uncultured Paraglaciecola sp.]|uniref:fimbrial biogenesis chaperone n=1 Tax=uncultured Paraglaciecola sp. TaxID=1765024 RepID=UPI00261601EF|nr:fimbria/pilus periplasmic chaperone [uncultured Paraglaciecola sp.]
MLTRVLEQAACGLFFFVVCASIASAGTIGVSPVRVTLSDSQKIGSLSVRNDGAEPVTMQMEVLSWSQREGNAVFAATRELLANPPIFTIPAGSSQLVRVGLRRAPDVQRELTYRVILQELPPPPDPDLTGARMTLRISLPVFVSPEIEAKPVLHWQAVRTSQGALKISLSNKGNGHIQIKNFKLSLLDSAQPWVTLQASDYVLAGQSRDWIVLASPENPAPPPGVTLQLFAQTDAGDIEAEVIIAP